MSLQLGGNAPFREFMKSYSPQDQGGYSENLSPYDTYHCWAATQYREKVHLPFNIGFFFVFLTSWKSSTQPSPIRNGHLQPLLPRHFKTNNHLHQQTVPPLLKACENHVHPLVLLPAVRYVVIPPLRSVIPLAALLIQRENKRPRTSLILRTWAKPMKPAQKISRLPKEDATLVSAAHPRPPLRIILRMDFLPPLLPPSMSSRRILSEP